MEKGHRRHSVFILILMAAITALLYVTQMDREAKFFYHLDIIFLSLFFIPIVLSGLWFGLFGGMMSSVAVTLLLLPYLVLHWEDWSAADLNRLLQTVVYFIVAAILGRVIETQRRQERRAKESENLAAIGRSMAAVAHDMKTPLVAIGGFSRLVQRHLNGDFPHRDKLDIVIQETQRLEEMVRDMLAFAKPMELDRSEADPRELIEETLAVAEEMARGRKVKLTHEVSDKTRKAMFDSMRMKQVLLNLVTNAIEASPEGEVVVLRCYNSRRSIVFEVIDCGCGIPPDKRRDVFYPFFTTKKEGTGLGLVTAKKIVEAHGGYLDVSDNPKKGTIFRVSLPNPCV